MYSIPQYDTLSGHYTNKKTIPAVCSQAIKMVEDLVTCLQKAISAARVAQNNPQDYQKVWKILSDD